MPAILDDEGSQGLREVRCLRRGRVRYVLRGRPRATLDVDFLVLVDQEHLERLKSQMIREGMELDESWLERNPLLRGFQLRFQGNFVDLLLPRDQHDHQIFRRRSSRRSGFPNGNVATVGSL